MPRTLDAGQRARCASVAPLDLDRARLVTVPWLTPGVGAMTLGRWILVRRGNDDDADLIAHEVVHVRQWRELGVFRFLVRYLGSYLRARLRGQNHRAAYWAIPLEVEAREVSRRGGVAAGPRPDDA